MERSDIGGLLNRHGFKFSKSMGQNFLIDANIPDKIVRLAEIGMSDGALEVGPGIGALTKRLAQAARRVVAVELDRRLIPILNEMFAASANVEIVHGDILKLDIAKLVSEKMPGLERHVCANLPYNITTPALRVFIEAGVFNTITVMVQREVARRICAKPGTSEYGAFTVYANYHTQPKILFDVPPECFMPRPKVVSSVLTMRTRPERMLAPGDEAMFFRVVRAAFRQRRKTLVNALHAEFGSVVTKDEIAKFITQCGFDEKIRGETFGIDEFARLSECFSPLAAQGPF